MGNQDCRGCPSNVADYIDRLRRQFDVQAVILFGSRARGDDDPESDWDLFVIANDIPAQWDERTRAIWEEKPVGVDVIAWTADEVRAFVHRPLILDIATEGVPLVGNVTWLGALAERHMADNRLAKHPWGYARVST